MNRRYACRVALRGWIADQEVSASVLMDAGALGKSDHVLLECLELQSGTVRVTHRVPGREPKTHAPSLLAGSWRRLGLKLAERTRFSTRFLMGRNARLRHLLPARPLECFLLRRK